MCHDPNGSSGRTAGQKGYTDECPLTVASPKPAEWSPEEAKQELKRQANMGKGKKGQA
jgi:hypothetical protein